MYNKVTFEHLSGGKMLWGYSIPIKLYYFRKITQTNEK